MYCSNCGAQVPDGSRFCSNCGSSPSPAVSIPIQPQPKTRSSGCGCLAGLAGVLFTLAILFLLFFLNVLYLPPSNEIVLLPDSVANTWDAAQQWIQKNGVNIPAISRKIPIIPGGTTPEEISDDEDDEIVINEDGGLAECYWGLPEEEGDIYIYSQEPNGTLMFYIQFPASFEIDTLDFPECAAYRCGWTEPTCIGPPVSGEEIGTCTVLRTSETIQPKAAPTFADAEYSCEYFQSGPDYHYFRCDGKSSTSIDYETLLEWIQDFKYACAIRDNVAVSPVDIAEVDAPPEDDSPPDEETIPDDTTPPDDNSDDENVGVETVCVPQAFTTNAHNYFTNNNQTLVIDATLPDDLVSNPPNRASVTFSDSSGSSVLLTCSANVNYPGRVFCQNENPIPQWLVDDSFSADIYFYNDTEDASCALGWINFKYEAATTVTEEPPPPSTGSGEEPSECDPFGCWIGEEEWHEGWGCCTIGCWCDGGCYTDCAAHCDEPPPPGNPCD